MAVSDDRRTAELLQRLDAVEARLDPRPHRRGRLVADLATVGVLAPVAIYADWHASHPILLFGLMLLGIGLNHLIPFLTRWSLRRERDRLVERYAQAVAAGASSARTAGRDAPGGVARPPTEDGRRDPTR